MSNHRTESNGNLNMKFSSTNVLNQSNDENSPRLSNNGHSSSRKRLSSVKSNKTLNNDSNAELKNVHSTDLRKPLKHSSSIGSHIIKIGENQYKKNSSNNMGLQSKIKNLKLPNGKKDMSDALCKEYSAIPTDENGETIDNSPEAILFRTNYSLNPTPSINFNFDSIQPVHYNGQNTSIHEIFKNSNHSGKAFLGKMTLYYATSTKNAEEIINSKKFTPKSFGKALHFADNKQTAIYRAAIKDTELANSLIVANVDMGTALIFEGPNIKFNLEQVKNFQCNSVLHRKDQNSDWEYSVYEPSKIQFIVGYIFR